MTKSCGAWWDSRWPSRNEMSARATLGLVVSIVLLATLASAEPSGAQACPAGAGELGEVLQAAERALSADGAARSQLALWRARVPCDCACLFSRTVLETLRVRPSAFASPQPVWPTADTTSCVDLLKTSPVLPTPVAVFRVLVRANASVAHLEVVRGSGVPACDICLEKAIKSMLFVPAMKNGRFVDGEAVITLHLCPR